MGKNGATGLINRFPGTVNHAKYLNVALASSLIYIDMYHEGHIEAAVVPGFTFAPSGEVQPAPSTPSSAATSASSL
jgi:hypothetical protein